MGPSQTLHCRSLDDIDDDEEQEEEVRSTAALASVTEVAKKLASSLNVKPRPVLLDAVKASFTSSSKASTQPRCTHFSKSNWLKEGEGPFPRNTIKRQTSDRYTKTKLEKLLDRDEEAQRNFCDLMHRHGFVIVELPEKAKHVLNSAVAVSRAFFSQRNAEKDRHRTPSFQGFTTPRPGLHECFEYRRFSRDPTWSIPTYPSQFEGAVDSMYEVLYRVSLVCLDTLRIGMDIEEPDAFKRVLDHEFSPAYREGITKDSFLKNIDLSHLPKTSVLDNPYQKSLTAMRILHYDRVQTIAEEKAQHFLGDHTDSTMLTVSPRPSMNGLDILPYQQGRPAWEELECHMDQRDCVVFAGDCLARYTLNYYPALMHRPSVESMVAGLRSQADSFLRRNPRAREIPISSILPRVATPFFLRPRIDAYLDPQTLKSPALAHLTHPDAILPETVRGPLSMQELDSNAKGTRDNWVWKQLGTYYTTMTYSDEKD